MINKKTGEIKLANDMTINPLYKFEDFKQSNYYSGEDGIRIVYIKERLKIEDGNYVVSLFFRNGYIYIYDIFNQLR